MKIAVALATYNGSRFLKEQLTSLLQQTRKPDQVVISDDGSSDDTVAIAQDFKHTATFRVEVLRGQGQLGPMGNFLRAAEACEGEYIAFCDQDDVWFSQKLELCEQALVSTGSLAVIHSIKHFAKSATRVLPAGRVEPRFRVVDGLQVPPNEIVLGMCMIVERRVLGYASQLKQLWEPRFDVIAKTRPLSLIDHWSHAHDTYLFTTARLLGQLTFMKTVLALHRLHQNNYSRGGSMWAQSPEVEGSWEQGANRGYRLLNSHCEDFANMLEGAIFIPLPERRRQAALEYYQRWSAIWRYRATLLGADAGLGARAICLANIFGKGGYRGYYNGGLGIRSFGKDCLNALGIRIGRGGICV
jgi:glycosyltransferase involved in cell wall biosynthesis